jgi:predicted Zn-dependent protease
MIQNRMSKYLGSVVWASLSLFLFACAAREPKLMWEVKHIARLPSDVIVLQDPVGQPLATVNTRDLKRILLAKIRIARFAGVDAELIIVDGKDPNALAGLIPGRHVIAINVGMLKLLGDDIDAAASLIGHEAAHLAKRHGETGQTRTKTIRGIGSMVGVGLGMAGVPAAGTLTGLAVDFIDASYDRTQEREADSLGVGYMISAGYDPQGAIRLHEKLLQVSGGTLLPFLSSHPSGEERIQSLKELINTTEITPPNPVR